MSILHQPGDIIQHKYRVIDVLGKGSSGITYRVEDIATQQQIALKALSLHRLKDWKQVELFEREASVLAKLEHPGIPEYLDYFQIDTPNDRAFYIAQAIAPEKSLAEWVETGWRTREIEVKQIAEQVLLILVYLHSLDPPVIHRDIKPDNIIRDRRGNIYLVDFGAVQNTYHNTLMQGSTVVGTYGYMSPEQFRGKAVPATDLYSLGATLLYLLTHRSPAELPQDTLKLDFRASVNISEEFGDWLDKILEPSLEYRYTSAKEALAVLQRKERFIKDNTLRKNEVSGVSGLKIIFATVFLILSVAGFVNHWKILSFLGYHPINVCRNSAATRYYLLFGGKLDTVVSDLGRGRKPLIHCLVGTKDRDILHLLSKREINSTNKQIYDRVLFFDAVYRGDLALVRNFLSHKLVDINIKTYKEQATALHIAVSQENLFLVKLLIENKIEIDTVAKKKYLTPLHQAIRKNNLKIAKLLLEKGAAKNSEVDADNDTFEFSKWRIDITPISEAVFQGNVKAIALLIDYDTSLDINYDLSYAIVEQISNNNLEVIELLLNNDVDIQSISRNKIHSRREIYNSLLYLAEVRSSSQMVELLKKYGVR